MLLVRGVSMFTGGKQFSSSTISRLPDPDISLNLFLY